VAGTTALGVWQSQRYFWKLEQIDQRAQTLAQAPARLPTYVSLHAFAHKGLTNARTNETSCYNHHRTHQRSEEEERLGGATVEALRPYTLTGRFLHDRELRVGAFYVRVYIRPPFLLSSMPC
jgi:cytochrome oxidase assembly protein ShyY1